MPRRYRTKEMILKQSDDGYGYLQVRLTKKSVLTTFKVHRLVAKTFVENPYNYNIVDHINGDRTDNSDKNLRWVESCKENVNNPITYERIKKAIVHRAARQVQQILDGQVVAEYESAAEAARALNICDVPIRKCCIGTETTYKGFTWRYKEKEAS